MWVALSLKTEATVSVLGKAAAVPISGLADDCVGCLLVFSSREAAAEYVGEGGGIIQVEFTEPQCSSTVH